MKGIVKYLVLLLAGILAASCVFDADQSLMPVDEPRNITFTVSLDNQKTRAAWEEGYVSDEGVPFDYLILPDKLRVVILDQDGSSVASINDLEYWPLNVSQTIFQFIGQMPAEFIEYFNKNPQKQNYRFMVLANSEDNLQGEEYITYNYKQLDPASENASIPMWGVKEVNVSSLINNEILEIGDIWLLRSAAKIVVKLSEQLKEEGRTSITSATLKYYNQTGYNLPYGWSQVSDTRKLDQENCMRLYRHAAVNLPLIKDDTTGDYYVYITEYDNINYTGERNKISLEFNVNGQKKTFADAISFCDYSGGMPLEDSDYNIVRNHIYDFEIMSIAGSNLILNYTVADWDAEQWDTDNDGVYEDYEEHDLAYPTYHNPVVPREYLSLSADDMKNYTIMQEPEMYYNMDEEVGAFECFFHIRGPENVKWKPAITGSLEKYCIRIYNYNINDGQGELLYDTAKKIQPFLHECETTNEWYRIVIFPRGPDGADENIDFFITYEQDWTEQSINLYINGEYNNIRWPGSGDNPKIINIKHVSQEMNVTE